MLRFMLAVAGMALSMLAVGQPYPTKPVKIVVSFSAGNSIDATARAVARKLSDAWGQPVLVDNRPGGGGTGTLGTDFVAKSPPDGYTWLLAPNSVMSIAPHLVKTPYDVFKDFTPVAQVVSIPFVLVVHPSLPFDGVGDLIKDAKANPGKLNYGSSGNGSPSHLGGELISRAGGISMVHVPYKGAPAIITDLLGGRLQVFVGALGTLAPHIATGKLKLLAAAGPHRLADYPNVPTLAEAVAGVEVDAWLGMFMPAGAPKEIVDKVSADITRVLGLPEIKANLASQGIESAPGSPAALTALMRADYARWGRLISDANIRAD